MAKILEIRYGPTKLLYGLLNTEERRKNSRLRILRANNERILVECDGRAYLFLVIGSALELTPGKITKRLRSWRQLDGRTIQGYLLLAPEAEVSPTTAAARGSNLPPNVVVIGAWTKSDHIVISNIDDSIAYLLDVIGFSGTATRSSQRKSVQTSNSLKRNPELESAIPSVKRVTRQLRKGLHLDVYELEKRLGRGFSAEVWKAKVTSEITGLDLKIGDDVAVKVYSLAQLRGSQSIRIQREFEIATNSEHPRLARVYDLVISPSRPFHTFMVMEYVNGPTLKEHISKKGRLSYIETVTVGIQVFEALEELHSLGAIHRDVKAANIMLSNDGASLEVKLVDLGIVSITEDTGLTAASVFLGSKHSAPLEQLKGEELDERTDIYGVGSVLYNCIHGRAMYEGAGPEVAIAIQMLSAPVSLPAPPQATGEELQLIQFINSCIEVRKENRPVSAEDCLVRLKEISDRLS